MKQKNFEIIYLSSNCKYDVTNTTKATRQYSLNINAGMKRRLILEKQIESENEKNVFK